MEGLAAAGGVFAVVSLAAQVAQGCNYLRGIFDSANSAPREIRLLSTEIGIIQGIVEGMPDVNKYHDELDFCHERLSKLRKVVDKYGVLDGVERNKKYLQSLSIASSRVSAPTFNGIRTFPDNLALSSGQNIDFGESSTSFGKGKRTHLSPIAHRKNPSFWEPLEADFEDDVEGNEQPHVEKMSKYRSRFGEVRMRTASTTYSSLVALKAANGDVASGFHWSQPENFPVTVTATEILLLPRNWSKSRLTTIKYQALTHPMLNTRDMPLNGQIHKGSGGLTKLFIAAPITQRQDRLAALQTLEVASTVVRPLTKPSILDVAFETALPATGSKVGNAVVPAVPMETISRQN